MEAFLSWSWLRGGHDYGHDYDAAWACCWCGCCCIWPLAAAAAAAGESPDSLTDWDCSGRTPLPEGWLCKLTLPPGLGPGLEGLLPTGWKAEVGLFEGKLLLLMLVLLSRLVGRTGLKAEANGTTCGSWHRSESSNMITHTHIYIYIYIFYRLYVYYTL